MSRKCTDEPGDPRAMPEELGRIRRNLRGIMPGAAVGAVPGE